ncbi:MAG: cob(I)yrinic acid a,c-diamide adenosyltransferase [Deltaproteobacteria bacterium]|nr:MAG: cob(I)yrinic acid a,c-diamide adenosyltransferase [Deltaproteobacteria bacterium]
MKGYVHVYTGDGKGKTTAAIGLAIRAAGAGRKVFIGQFLKSGEYSEHKALERFSDLIEIKQYGRGCFIYGAPEDEDIKAAREGLNEVRDIINSGEYDLVILDEANIAVYYKFFEVSKLLDIVRSRPEHVEIVITGRMADQSLIDEADLVTEMKEIKHYYKKGVIARPGIER